MLCDKSLGLSKRILCFKASVLSSMGWQSGSWTLTEKTGGTSGFLGCAAPRPHARAKKRTRGRHWLFLDEDIQNGSSVHEKAQHISCEARSLFKNTERPVTSHVSMNRTPWQKCSTAVTSVGGVNNNKIGKVNGNKGRSVHSARFACWRWEQDFELSYGKHTRGENENAISVGWKALLAQLRPEWKTLEQQF